jgi:integrase
MSNQRLVAPGIYQLPSGSFVYRRMTDGRRTMHTLKARALPEAIKEASTFVAPEPCSLTFRALAYDWCGKGCPNVFNEPQPAHHQERCARLLRQPLDYFGSKLCNEIGPIMVDDYYAWRSTRITRKVRDGAGRRMTDAELTICSTMFKWAYRRELVKSTPFQGRGVRQKATMVSHCTDRAPSDASIVHAVASHMLKDYRGQSSAFLWLFICLTGCRTLELRELRLDGLSTGNTLLPGSFTDTHMVIRRAKMRDRAGAVCPIPLRPEAQSLLSAWKHWHSTQHSASPFWFPGRSESTELSPAALHSALTNACRALGLPPVAPHGGRSFFCKVLRSLLPDDRLVADALGHTTIKLVESTYGKRNPGDAALSFLPPTGKPAWYPFLPPTQPDNILTLPTAITA